MRISASKCLLLALISFGAIFASITPVSACINDVETRDATPQVRGSAPLIQMVYTRLKGLPEADIIIAGGFARFPAEYYQARIDGLVPIIEARELDSPFVAADELGYLSLFDDLAVAYERIGKSEEAIAWMDRKLEELERLGYQSDEQSSLNQRYTYYANIGTFRVHAWLKQGGAKRKNMEQLDQAMAEIARAIEIYPEAHDGREGYQLQAMEWIRDLPDQEDRRLTQSGNKETVLPDLLGITAHLNKLEGDGDVDEWKERSRRVVEEKGERYHQLKLDLAGMTGLISMGAAWESVDVFYALGLVLRELGEQGSSLYAFERASKLARDGKKSLAAPSLNASRLADLIATQVPLESDCKFADFSHDPDIEERARSWSSTQYAYISERLADGYSPVDIEAFWRDWSGERYFMRYERAIQHDIANCRLESDQDFGTLGKVLRWIVGLAFLMLLVILIGRFFRRRSRRSRLQMQGETQPGLNDYQRPAERPMIEGDDLI